MKDRYHILLLLLVIPFFGHGQNRPAALRENSVYAHADEIDRGDSEKVEQNCEKQEEKITHTSFKKPKKKYRKRRSNAFGSFLMILGLLLFLGGIAAFFFYSFLGAWVILISLASFILSFLFIWWSAEQAGSGGLGIAIGGLIVGIIAAFIWVIGSLVIGLVSIFGN